MALHPVDVKARLKKRYGSVLAFERQCGLPPESVRDVLRGRSNERVAHAIADELGIAMHHLFLHYRESRNRDDSVDSGRAHQENKRPVSR